MTGQPTMTVTKATPSTTMSSALTLPLRYGPKTESVPSRAAHSADRPRTCVLTESLVFCLLAGPPSPAARDGHTRQVTSLRTTWAGLPDTTTSPGTSVVTTLPVPTTAPSPIVAPITVAPQPIHTRS